LIQWIGLWHVVSQSEFGNATIHFKETAAVGGNGLQRPQAGVEAMVRWPADCSADRISSARAALHRMTNADHRRKSNGGGELQKVLFIFAPHHPNTPPIQTKKKPQLSTVIESTVQFNKKGKVHRIGKGGSPTLPRVAKKAIKKPPDEWMIINTQKTKSEATPILSHDECSFE